MVMIFAICTTFAIKASTACFPHTHTHKNTHLYVRSKYRFSGFLISALFRYENVSYNVCTLYIHYSNAISIIIITLQLKLLFAYQIFTHFFRSLFLLVRSLLLSNYFELRYHFWYSISIICLALCIHIRNAYRANMSVVKLWEIRWRWMKITME